MLQEFLLSVEEPSVGLRFSRGLELTIELMAFVTDAGGS